jgi:phospholipase B1
MQSFLLAFVSALALTDFIAGQSFTDDHLEWLEKWRDIYGMMKSDPELRDSYESFMRLREQHAKEARVPSIPFECEPQPEMPPPTSVNQLRPADVKIVATMGDSITAGHGVGAENLLAVAAMNRGEVWSIGGDESLEFPVITLTNVLRKFNPSVRGYSYCGSVTQLRPSKAGFNMADPGARNVHLPQQTEDLIARMKNDTRIDYNNDWKVVTILLGGNDLCGYCRNPESNSPENYVSNFRIALDTMMAEMPRTFVNVKAMMDITPLYNMTDDTGWCDFMHEQFCSCVMNEDGRAEIRDVQLGYYYGMKELIDSGRYEKDDFTVVLQPHLRDQEPFIDPETGRYDLSYVSPDCFHPSRKAHEGFAFMIWNMMLTPVGQKPFEYADEDFPTYVCPTEEHPYIFTARNSNPDETDAAPSFGLSLPIVIWALCAALLSHF